MATEVKDLNLRKLLVEAGRDLADILQPDSSHYFLIDLERAAQAYLGSADFSDYRGEKVLVPYNPEKVKKSIVKSFPAADLAGRVQLINGFVLSPEVAELSGFVALPYVPQPTMYLKCL